MKRHMLKFAKLSDDFGCPRSSYDNTHLEVHEDARQSQRKADRQARSAKAHALSEMENRAKAARFEREMRMKQASTTSFTTPKTNSKAVAHESLAKVMGVGVWAPTCRSSQICQQPSGINKGNAKCNYYRGYSRASVAGVRLTNHCQSLHLGLRNCPKSGLEQWCQRFHAKRRAPCRCEARFY